jgi:hypothetical protein
MTDLKLLKSDVQTALDRAACMSGRFHGAVNWADLKAKTVSLCVDEAGETRVRVLIEEADPDNGDLREFILSCLVSRGWAHAFDKPLSEVLDFGFEW